MSESEVNSVISEANLKEFDWDHFKYERILSNNSSRKVVFILGSCFEMPAIVILEKISFTQEQFTTENDKENFIRNSKLEKIFKNDIYENNYCIVDANLNKMKTTIIFPATEKHINKYTEQECFTFQETPELYEKITLPHITSEKFTVDWVYNVLEHKKEKDRIIIEDLDSEIGFMLLPDLKWDGETKETLYVTAIIMNRNIKSIRELRQKHLPLLENVKTKSLQAIKEKYGLDSTQVRAYFHYQPSYYHLHVHFNYLNYDSPGIYCDKAHLLDTVINNIKLMSNYYEKATLNFVVRKNDKLYSLFSDAKN
ncbi:hypothetical protein PVAND_007378 [Polypedilum vanderplanki]|uniref:m7GpppX diphosphatase n=1 Tax=Polypedilum vanderplanki TaxID=319348 RepID=A0A9J6C6T6_POLVA|nr:hypothetical protein PVAND_007378 [Polypedilum vanderplanki]